MCQLFAKFPLSYSSLASSRSLFIYFDDINQAISRSTNSFLLFCDNTAIAKSNNLTVCVIYMCFRDSRRIRCDKVVVSRRTLACCDRLTCCGVTLIHWATNNWSKLVVSCPWPTIVHHYKVYLLLLSHQGPDSKHSTLISPVRNQQILHHFNPTSSGGTPHFSL